MRSLFRALRFLVTHPLNRGHAVRAVSRYVRWQVRSRLLSGEIAVPFVNESRLLVSPGMTGATGNIYCGLHEFEDMAFVLHATRPGDRFVDVGANVGSYTILAAVAGCTDIISLEPAESTFQALARNIILNGFASRVRAEQLGVGAGPAVLRFTAGLDTVNHVVASGEDPALASEVEVRALDTIVGPVTAPTLVKIDVEGYESEVIAGASAVLASDAVFAVLMELNGSGRRYGFDEDAIHARMLAFGFAPMAYEPFARTLSPVTGRGSKGNTLYVRDARAVGERVRNAPRFTVWNGSI